MAYKYRVIVGASVWNNEPTTYPKAKATLEEARSQRYYLRVFAPSEFEIERVLQIGNGRRYWRKVYGKWVMYPQCLKRSEELTPYEHYTYDPRTIG
jgi:hypothetical protein